MRENVSKKRADNGMEKQIGIDCSCCDFAEKLFCKDLENDFVYCCNPDCKYHYHVLFEHFRCQKNDA